jgi:type IV secretion system protein VirB10
MSAGEASAADAVLGERSATLVNRAASVQARLSNVLALILMSALGLGSLAWYYTSNLTQRRLAHAKVQSAAVSHAQGDTALPSLGRIDPPLPMPVVATPSAETASGATADPQAAPVPLAASPLAEIPLAGTSQASYAPPAPPTPAQLAQQRQLSGSVFSSASQGPPEGETGVPADRSAIPGAAAPGIFVPPAAPAAPGELSALLRPSTLAAVRAEMLPAQRLLLPKGAFIDCTLETAIDSTLPGMTTCIMATDTFGVDGNVVLLERGTKLIGETRGQVQQGQARIFVLWTEARTPTGVVVPLASPGADELGRSGLPGEVNSHFWARFGAAMLISVIDGAVDTAAQSSRSGSGTVIVDPSASQGVMTEVLKGTINIAPTVVKRNGDRIQVLVARDLDFRSVYELRSAAAAR